MKKFEVTLFIMGVGSSCLNEKVIIEAKTQDEAEEIAHKWYFPKGYGVLDSKEIMEEE